MPNPEKCSLWASGAGELKCPLAPPRCAIETQSNVLSDHSQSHQCDFGQWRGIMWIVLHYAPPPGYASVRNIYLENMCCRFLPQSWATVAHITWYRTIWSNEYVEHFSLIVSRRRKMRHLQQSFLCTAHFLPYTIWTVCLVQLWIVTLITPNRVLSLWPWLTRFSNKFNPRIFTPPPPTWCRHCNKFPLWTFYFTIL